jgi:hypothetical protein
MRADGKFTINRPKNYKKSLLCGLISQTLAEKPPKNGGMRKANSTPASACRQRLLHFLKRSET